MNILRATDVCVAIAWAASEMVLFIGDRDAALQGGGLCIYLALLWFAIDRWSPATVAAGSFDASEPEATLRARCIVVAVTILALTFVYAFIGNQVLSLPVLSPLWSRWVLSEPPLGATAIPNAILYVVAPGTVLVMLGLRLKSIGLVAPHSGFMKALAVALALPLVILVSLLVVGRLSLGRLVYIAVRNFLSAGATEEILFRGFAMAHLRPFVGVAPALLLQAAAFALFHLASSLNEPSPFILAAYLIALNGVPGYLFGRIAIRTDGLLIPISIHTSMGILRNAF